VRKNWPYLLAGITTPGDEAHSRSLQELHLVGSAVSNWVRDRFFFCLFFFFFEMIPLSNGEGLRRDRRTCLPIP